MSDESLSKSDPSESRKNQVRVSVSHYLEQLAIALDWNLPPERELLYLRSLEDLGTDQLKHGFTVTLKTFKPQPYLRFPLPGQIREACLDYVAPTPPPRYELEDSTLEDRKQFSDQLFTELRRTIDAGAFRMPTVQEAAEALARERNGGSSMPADPKDRAPWARALEIKNGWRNPDGSIPQSNEQPLSVNSLTVPKETHVHKGNNRRRS